MKRGLLRLLNVIFTLCECNVVIRTRVLSEITSGNQSADCVQYVNKRLRFIRQSNTWIVTSIDQTRG